MANPAPAFQFYPRDFLADPAVQKMTVEEVGAYWLILCSAWQSENPGHVLNDSEELALTARMTSKQWERASKAVMRALKVTDDGKWLYSKRMIAERDKQLKRRKQTSDAGKASGEARAHLKADELVIKNALPDERALNERSTNDQREPSTSSPSRSLTVERNPNPASAICDLPSASATAKNKEREPGARARVIGAQLTTQWGQRWKTRVLMPDQWSITAVAALLDEYMTAAGEADIDAFVDRAMKAFLAVLASWSFEGAATPQMFAKKWQDIQTVLGGRDPAAKRAPADEKRDLTRGQVPVAHIPSPKKKAGGDS